MSNSLLVTGVAGFIGFHLARRLLSEGKVVVGIDSLNDYYDPQLKRDRLNQLLELGLIFRQIDLTDWKNIQALFQEHQFETVVHLAAQAGVRYSKTNPHAYVASNIDGFLNILEGCRHFNIRHLLYASSSSVYGANREMPFSTDQKTDRPVSLYGATKKANELMAHSYSWMYGLPATGLRFFTVYGPWGRPDMALYLFADAIIEQKSLQLFNYGQMNRDFTYVDDIVEGISRLLPLTPTGSTGEAAAHRVLNIGSHNPVALERFLELIEQAVGRKALVEKLPMQSGDVASTFAEVSDLETLTGFRPSTSLEQGIENSIAWYLEYRKLRART